MGLGVAAVVLQRAEIEPAHADGRHLREPTGAVGVQVHPKPMQTPARHLHPSGLLAMLLSLIVKVVVDDTGRTEPVATRVQMLIVIITLRSGIFGSGPLSLISIAEAPRDDGSAHHLQALAAIDELVISRHRVQTKEGVGRIVLDHEVEHGHCSSELSFAYFPKFSSGARTPWRNRATTSLSSRSALVEASAPARRSSGRALTTGGAALVMGPGV